MGTSSKNEASEDDLLAAGITPEGEIGKDVSAHFTQDPGKVSVHNKFRVYMLETWWLFWQEHRSVATPARSDNEQPDVVQTMQPTEPTLLVEHAAPAEPKPPAQPSQPTLLVEHAPAEPPSQPTTLLVERAAPAEPKPSAQPSQPTTLLVEHAAPAKPPAQPSQPTMLLVEHATQPKIAEPTPPELTEPQPTLPAPTAQPMQPEPATPTASSSPSQNAASLNDEALNAIEEPKQVKGRTRQEPGRTTFMHIGAVQLQCHAGETQRGGQATNPPDDKTPQDKACLGCPQMGCGGMEIF